MLSFFNICFIQVDGDDFAITHRVHKIKIEGTSVKFLTKGDNNSDHDQNWLTRNNVIGRVRRYLPYAGTVIIKMHEYLKIDSYFGGGVSDVSLGVVLVSLGLYLCFELTCILIV